MNIRVILDKSAYENVRKTILSARTTKRYGEAVGQLAFARWVELANQRLTTRRRAYLDGASYRISGASAILTLLGKFPNMIEHGNPQFDMRKELLTNGRTSRVIAFKHLTPGASGKSGMGTPMGQAYGSGLSKQAVASLGRQVYQAAKSLTRGESLESGVGGIGLLRPWHSRDLYSGMQKARIGKPGNYEYITFRTISEGGEPGSWQYPARSPTNIMQDLAKELPEIAEQAYESVIAAAVKSKK